MITCARQAVDGQPYEFHRCDIRDEDSVSAWSVRSGAAHGRLDMLVNSAGGSPYAPPGDTASTERSSSSVLLAPLLVSQRANVLIRRPNGGSIVNIWQRCVPLPARRPMARPRQAWNLTTTLAVEWAPQRFGSTPWWCHGIVRTVGLFCSDAGVVALASPPRWAGWHTTLPTWLGCSVLASMRRHISTGDARGTLWRR